MRPCEPALRVPGRYIHSDGSGYRTLSGRWFTENRPLTGADNFTPS